MSYSTVIYRIRTSLYIDKVQEPNNAKFIEDLPEIRQMMTKIALMKFRYVLQ